MSSKYPKEARESRLLTIWYSMRQRCYGNKNSESYKKYGAKGIRICDEWKNDYMSFYNWAMSNGYSDVCEELWDILSFIDSMQEEPVSNPIDFEQELYKAFGQVKDFTLGMRIAKRFYDMGKNSQEPVCEELEKAAENYGIRQGAELRPFAIKYFKAGAKWQKEHLWKPAEGDDLPIFDREVIVFTQPYPLEGNEYAVSFAHRPNPDGWDGKSLTSGNVEHYTPKTYDNGGWNIPNVKYWLDCLLPNMED